MFEKSLAIVVLVVCLVLMGRLLLGPRRRQRFDAAVRRAGFTIRRRAFLLYHWRASRRSAERVAEETIRRAREGGSWDGNVYRPKSFKGPRKPH
jgi:hypothetical protein